jgi:hypothetical protein
MPDKAVGKVNLQRLADAHPAYGPIVNVFDDPDEALQWLESVQ